MKLKSYISVFFLLAFLSPSVIKEVHAVHHEEKLHCDAEGEKHLHEHHHDCTFCNFVLPVVAVASKTSISFFISHFAEYFFPSLIEVFFSSYHFYSSQLRAPPILS